MSGNETASQAIGLFDGINNAVSIMRDDKSRREKEQRDNTLYDQQKTKYTQGQEDRSYALERRAVNDERADTGYDRGEELRLRQERGASAINGAFVRGDTTEANEFLNENTPDGISPNLVIKDGKYFAEMPDPKTGKVTSKELSKKDVFMTIQRVMKSGSQVFDDYQKQFDTDAAGEKLKGDRKHDLDKIRLQNEGRTNAALLRSGAKSASAKGKIPEYSKQSAKLAANFYGGKFENGVFSFGEKGNDAKAAATATLTDILYKSKPENSRNINAQFREATMLVETASKEAAKIAKSDEESGALEDAGITVEDRTAQILQAIIEQSISSIKPEKTQSPALEKNKSVKEGGGEQKKITRKEYFNSLRSNPKFKDRTDDQIKARVLDMMKKYPERFMPESKQAGNRGVINRTDSKDVAALNRDGYSKRKKQSKAAIS